jgi:hypothetical protein
MAAELVLLLFIFFLLVFGAIGMYLESRREDDA